MNRLYYILSALLLMGLLSCSKEEGGESRVTRVEGCVQMSINVPSLPVVKSSSGTDEGTVEERAIHSLRVYAFIEGQRVGYSYQTSSIKTHFLMKVDVELSEVQPSVQTVNFYIVANEAAMVMEQDMPQIGPKLTEEQLKGLRFIAIAPNEGLPLYCMESRQINIMEYGDMSTLSPEIAAGHEGDLLIKQKQTFNLTRSVGKLTLSVKKSKETIPDVYIKSVTMLARGTRHYNYLMPQSEDFLKTLSPRVNDRAILAEGTTYTVTSTEFEEVASAYCSENPYGSPAWNIPNSDNSVVLHAQYSMGEGTELRNAYIYLPKIERNQWININCVARGEGTISVEYKVKDWELASEDEDYVVFDYPTHSYILPGLPTMDEPLPDFTDNFGNPIEPVTSVAKPFSGYFQILHPEGQKWYPTIIRVQAGNGAVAGAGDFEIEVYNVASDGKETPATYDDGYGLNPETNTYFRICVRPKNQDTVGAQIYLGITTELQGFGYTEYLLINGSQSELYWPSNGGGYSGGTDPNVLIITQIEEN